MLIITLLSLVTAVACAVVAWRVIRREQLRSDARVAYSRPPSTNPLSWRTPSTGQMMKPPHLFNRPERSFYDANRPAFRRRPLLTAAAGLAVVVAVIVLIAMTGDRHDRSAEAPVAPSRASLELLSMRSARDGATLAVTGLVRNPSDDAGRRPSPRSSRPLTAGRPSCGERKRAAHHPRAWRSISFSW